MFEKAERAIVDGALLASCLWLERYYTSNNIFYDPSGSHDYKVSKSDQFPILQSIRLTLRSLLSSSPTSPPAFLVKWPPLELPCDDAIGLLKSFGKGLSSDAVALLKAHSRHEDALAILARRLNDSVSHAVFPDSVDPLLSPRWLSESSLEEHKRISYRVCEITQYLSNIKDLSRELINRHLRPLLAGSCGIFGALFALRIVLCRNDKTYILMDPAYVCDLLLETGKLTCWTTPQLWTLTGLRGYRGHSSDEADTTKFRVFARIGQESLGSEGVKFVLESLFASEFYSDCTSESDAADLSASVHCEALSAEVENLCAPHNGWGRHFVIAFLEHFLREILTCSTTELRSNQHFFIVLLKDQVKRSGQDNIPTEYMTHSWAFELLFKMYVEAIDEICRAKGSGPPIIPSLRLTAEPSALLVEFRKRMLLLILASPLSSLGMLLNIFSKCQNSDFLVEEQCLILNRTGTHQAVVSLLEFKLRDHSAAEEYRSTFADSLSTCKYRPVSSSFELGGSLFDRLMPTDIAHETEMARHLASVPLVKATEAAISPSTTAASLNTHKQSRLRSLEALRLLPDAMPLTEVLALLSETVIQASDELRAAATARSLAQVSARQRKAGLALQQAQCAVLRKDGVCAECGRRIASDRRGIGISTSEFVFSSGIVLHPTCAKGVVA